MSEKKKSVFETLSKIDVSEHIEKKKTGDGKVLDYLSWAWGWSLVKSIYPESVYEVKFFDGKPYVFDENLGYMVFTSVTIENETQGAYLPVMNGANKAMKHTHYKYVTKYGEKSVEPATMFDVNTALQRCLAKNLGMFGLGIALYVGEDIKALFGDDDKKEDKCEDINLSNEISILFDKCLQKGVLTDFDKKSVEDNIKFAKEEHEKASILQFLQDKFKENPIKEQIAELHKKIKKGLEMMKYEVTHQKNSILKHLGVEKVEDCKDIDVLAKYYQHLRDEYENKKKEF